MNFEQQRTPTEVAAESFQESTPTAATHLNLRHWFA
jgi:hypothetical protein